MIKCLGCGAILQDKLPLEEGYTKDLNNKLCERCFNIKHYNKYVKMPNKDYSKIIKDIDKRGDLILLVTDFLSLYNLDEIEISSPVILVFTKADLMPRGIDKERLINKIKCKLNVIDRVCVSSKNNYNLDLLYEKIVKNKKSADVYVIGYTNAGKSSLINKLVKNYGGFLGEITESNLPSTTLDKIFVKVNDNLTLIDTPGLLDNESMVLEASAFLLKKIVPRKEIRPLSFQVKGFQSLIIEDFMKVDMVDTNIVCYMSNDLDVRRIYKSKSSLLKRYDLNINKNSDLVIKGVGFISFKKDSKITLWLKDNIGFLIRDSII